VGRGALFEAGFGVGGGFLLVAQDELTHIRLHKIRQHTQLNLPIPPKTINRRIPHPHQLRPLPRLLGQFLLQMRAHALVEHEAGSFFLLGEEDSEAAVFFGRAN